MSLSVISDILKNLKKCLFYPIILSCSKNVLSLSKQIILGAMSFYDTSTYMFLDVILSEGGLKGSGGIGWEGVSMVRLSCIMEKHLQILSRLVKKNFVNENKNYVVPKGGHTLKDILINISCERKISCSLHC